MSPRVRHPRLSVIDAVLPRVVVVLEGPAALEVDRALLARRPSSSPSGPTMWARLDGPADRPRDGPATPAAVIHVEPMSSVPA